MRGIFLCVIQNNYWLLFNREIVQNNSPRWLETVCLYFPRLRLGKYSSPRSPVTSGSYFAQFPSWAVNICIIYIHCAALEQTSLIALPPLLLAIRRPRCNLSKTYIPFQARLSEVKQLIIKGSKHMVQKAASCGYQKTKQNKTKQQQQTNKLKQKRLFFQVLLVTVTYSCKF